MSTVSHDASLRDIQRALAIMIFTVGVLEVVAMLSVPSAIGLHGLRGLRPPAILLIPLALQAWAPRVLCRAVSALFG